LEDILGNTERWHDVRVMDARNAFIEEDDE
jgi:hypothetical protein